MSRRAWFLPMLVAGWAVSANAGVAPLPEEERVISDSGTYAFLETSVAGGKKFFSVSSITVQPAGGSAEVYRGEDLLRLVESSSPSVTYALRKNPDDPDSPVRGIGGKADGKVCFRLPMTEGAKDLEVTVTTFQDDTTGLRLTYWTSKDETPQSVTEEFQAQGDDPRSGVFRISIPGAPKP